MAVEAWFSILTRKSVRRGPFKAVRSPIRSAESYLPEWNPHPRCGIGSRGG